MFTTEEIKNAMNHLLELFPVAEVEELLEQNGDVVEALELDLLAKKFRKAASNVYLFTHSSGPEDSGTNTGKCLFDQRAAYIDTFSCEQQRIGGNQISSNHELINGAFYIYKSKYRCRQDGPCEKRCKRSNNTSCSVSAGFWFLYVLYCTIFCEFVHKRGRGNRLWRTVF